MKKPTDFSCVANKVQVARLAMKKFQDASSLEYPDEQYILKISYDKEKGGTRSIEKVIELLQKGVKDNNPVAQYLLGSCYNFGRGVAKNWKLAEKLYKLAAIQGLIQAQLSLGMCDDTVKDETKTTEYYKFAANESVG